MQGASRKEKCRHHRATYNMKDATPWGNHRCRTLGGGDSARRPPRLGPPLEALGTSGTLGTTTTGASRFKSFDGNVTRDRREKTKRKSIRDTKAQQNCTHAKRKQERKMSAPTGHISQTTTSLDASTCMVKDEIAYRPKP